METSWLEDLKNAAVDALGGIQAEGEVAGFDVTFGQRDSVPWPVVLIFFAVLVLIFAFRS